MSATCLCTKKFLNYRTDSDIKNVIFLLLLIVKGNRLFFADIWTIQKRRKNISGPDLLSDITIVVYFLES